MTPRPAAARLSPHHRLGKWKDPGMATQPRRATMKLLQVNYRRERGQDDPEDAEQLLADAEQLSGLPGLQWNIWIYDDAAGAGGGIYLFNTDEHARTRS